MTITIVHLTGANVSPMFWQKYPLESAHIMNCNTIQHAKATARMLSLLYAGVFALRHDEWFEAVDITFADGEPCPPENVQEMARRAPKWRVAQLEPTLTNNVANWTQPEWGPSGELSVGSQAALHRRLTKTDGVWCLSNSGAGARQIYYVDGKVVSPDRIIEIVDDMREAQR